MIVCPPGHARIAFGHDRLYLLTLDAEKRSTSIPMYCRPRRG
jgi:hypothetical protein